MAKQATTDVVKKPDAALTSDIESIRKGLEAGCQVAPLGETFEENLALADAYKEWGRKSQLWMAWNIGRICCAMSDDEGKYGANTVQRVAEHLELKDRIVYDMQKFYRTYSDHSQIAKLDSTGLGWSQARLICTVQDESKREEILERVKQERLTVNELSKVVKEMTSTPAPKSPSSGAAAGFDVLKYMKTGRKLVDEFHRELAEYLKNMQAAADVMANSPDDVFYAALPECRQIDKTVKALEEPLHNLQEYMQWEDNT